MVQLANDVSKLGVLNEEVHLVNCYSSQCFFFGALNECTPERMILGYVLW